MDFRHGYIWLIIPEESQESVKKISKDPGVLLKFGHSCTFVDHLILGTMMEA
jgi:hypothetical protein